MTALIVILATLWCLVGTAGFVYWWTAEYDLTVATTFFAVLLGILGPLAWIVGWGIHGDRGEDRVVIHKRK